MYTEGKSFVLLLFISIDEEENLLKDDIIEMIKSKGFISIDSLLTSSSFSPKAISILMSLNIVFARLISARLNV